MDWNGPKWTEMDWNRPNYYVNVTINFTLKLLDIIYIYMGWMWILTNWPLDYIIFVYSSYLQNFKVIKDQ